VRQQTVEIQQRNRILLESISAARVPALKNSPTEPYETPSASEERNNTIGSKRENTAPRGKSEDLPRGVFLYCGASEFEHRA
jgi:hypothetical protein